MGRPNSGGGGVKAVIYWPDAKQVSRIYMWGPEGAATSIKSSGSWHRAIVRLISSDQNALTECEESVAEEIDGLSEREEKAGRGKRKRASVRNNATANQVGQAFGERPKTQGFVAELDKDRKVQKKISKRHQDDAGEDVSWQVLKESKDARKRLFSELGDDEEDVQKINSENENNLEISDGSIREDGTDDDEPAETASDSDQIVKELREAAKESASNFFSVITKNFFKPGSDTCKYVEIVEIPKDVPKVDFSKGTNVFVPVSEKNKIKVNGGGDPAKMARLGLIALYGRDILKSAKGHRSGSKAMRADVLRALLCPEGNPCVKIAHDFTFSVVN
ncbi:hypothetical protein ONE63_005094 [Megalurothrips usitatus]|uniref:Uncharacterized protein n=1 Tax=Megalurothrips usitatus TaxID=439358 RepID=A0AAV7XYF9_9NEOP|nr:hypothetical protein ONE63_005094 [Megalurothrips usitatus]